MKKNDRGQRYSLSYGVNTVLHGLFLLCYALGVFTESCLLTAGRAIRAFFVGTVFAWVRRSLKALPHCLLRAAKWLFQEFCAPVLVLVKAGVNIARHLRQSFRRSVKEGFACIGASFIYLVIQLFKSLLHLLNYIAPAIAIWALVLTLNYYSNVDYALALKYDGYMIGYVESLDVYDEAEKMYWQRLASIQLTSDDVRVGAVSYSVVFVPEDQLTQAPALCDEMLQKSISDLTVASGVYIDDEYYGAIEDGDAMRQYLQMRLDTAIAATAMVPTVDENAEEEDKADDSLKFTGEVSARFLRDIQIVDGYYPQAGVVDSKSLYDMFDSIVDGEQIYVVESGDSPWKIAQKLDQVNLDELYALNPWMETGTIYPGDELIVSKAVPYLEVQLMMRVTYEEEILPVIERVESSKYYVGYLRVTDSGTAGVKEITADVVYENGLEVGREVVSEQVLSEPIPGEMIVGTKSNGYSSGSDVYTGSSTPVVASGTFRWPVPGRGVTCGYGGYPGHRGMDIGAPEGTPILAADGGLVEVSTVAPASWGWGSYIVINHGNGIKTLYAHTSARYVKVGQYVNKGDVIAAVGHTGWAVGNHLHIEVIVNGQRVNPARYIY